MTSKKITKIAELFTELTYSEIMEIADWFSGWTAIDAEGNNQEKTISSEQMAANVVDWACQNKTAKE